MRSPARRIIPIAIVGAEGELNNTFLVLIAFTSPRRGRFALGSDRDGQLAPLLA
jgi:ABC-type thiamine transport system ATPase subunit